MNERTIRLTGGGRIVVRPMTGGDAESVRAAFGRLSPTTLLRRFFSPVPRLTATLAADLTLVDEQHRIVLLALDDAGEVVGEARAVRRSDDPATAELALTVADHLQGRGLGTRLLRILRDEAARAGIDRLAGHVQVENVPAQAMLVRSRAVCWVAEPGVLAFEIPIGRPRTVTAEADAARRRSLGLAS